MKQYENIFNAKNIMYERVYDTETKKSEFNKIELTPCVYVPGPGDMRYFLDKDVTLTEKRFNSPSEMNTWCKSMSDMGMEYYGKTTPKYQYLRDKFYYQNSEYVNNDHNMRTWYLDIEVSQTYYKYNKNNKIRLRKKNEL